MLWNVMGLASRRDGSKISALETRTNWALENARDDIQELQHEIEQLNLVVKTLATICQQAGVFTEAQFADLRDFVDLEDGVLDGKAVPAKLSPKNCPKCGRQNNKLAKRCMWCEGDL